MSVTSESNRVPAASVRRGRPRAGERVIEALLAIAAVVSVVTTIGIVVSLLFPTIEFFGDVSIVEFFTNSRWTPLFADKNYGIWPLLVATLWVTAIATIIAVPLGIGAAIYLSEYARPGTRKALKPVLEVLAGIPTVVYGFFALTFLNPILIDWWPSANKPEFQNLLVAGIAMGIMIVPTIASLSEDAMSAVPRSLREGAYALASTKMQVATRVVVPAALSGIVAAIVLGVSRALGETMIVTIAAGLKTAGIPTSATQGAATMTGYIAGAGQGDLPIDSLDYLTIFAVGATLFVFTFLLNALSIRLVRKFREVYE
ncbi:phosphate ABC transporter permease subunit PstC [Micromonospora haikouensis]|uniref:phosphate ABC transporter permease subunit PstC n=1 Tax=Micromonospora haikouensis TaxID=686309 RepID=UPI00378F87DB